MVRKRRRFHPLILRKSHVGRFEATRRTTESRVTASRTRITGCCGKLKPAINEAVTTKHHCRIRDPTRRNPRGRGLPPLRLCLRSSSSRPSKPDTLWPSKYEDSQVTVSIEATRQGKLIVAEHNYRKTTRKKRLAGQRNQSQRRKTKNNSHTSQLKKHSISETEHMLKRLVWRLRLL